MKKLFEALKDFELFGRILEVQNGMTLNDQDKFLDRQFLKHPLVFAAVAQTFGEKTSGSAKLALMHLLLMIRDDNDLSDEYCHAAGVLISDEDWILREVIEIAKLGDAYYAKTKDILVVYRPEFLQKSAVVIEALAVRESLTDQQSAGMWSIFITGFYIALEIFRRAYERGEEVRSD